MSSPTSYELPARVVLVGVRGFGRVHAAQIGDLAEQGVVRLVATVDPGVETTLRTASTFTRIWPRPSPQSARSTS